MSSPLGDCPKCIFEWLLHNMENGLALLCDLVNCWLGEEPSISVIQSILGTPLPKLDLLASEDFGRDLMSSTVYWSF